jgi:hypothetical protein
VLLAEAITPLTASTAIQFGAPGIQISLGSDHLGYAHMAEWIVAHPPSERPRVDPAVPYESWPAFMLEGDPRFGTPAILAAVALLRGVSPLFAYDSTSAVVLTASILGVAAVFARSRLVLVLLVLGLLTAHWYDYTRTGYLAKAIGFPAAFFVAGLFMLACAPLRPRMLLPLALLTAGASSVYWAEAPSLFIGLLGGGFILARLALGGRASLRQPRRAARTAWQHAAVLALMGLIALLVRTYVAADPARPGANDFIAAHLTALVNPNERAQFNVPPLSALWLSLADLEHQAGPVTRLSPNRQAVMLLVSALSWLGLAGIAWYRRDPRAVALTSGPIALLAFLAPLSSSSARWTTYQLPGTFYPLALCAAASLAEGAFVHPRGSRPRVLAAALLLLLVGNVELHLPRFAAVTDRYAGMDTPTWLQFSQDDLDGLAAAIGSKTVRVDIDQPQLSYVVLLELAGRRGIDVQWAPASWRYILGYRGWPAPEPDRPVDFILRPILPPGNVVPDDPGTTLVYRSRQYLLRRVPG